MSKLSEDKREVLAYIDAILTMIEKYPTFNLGNSIEDINLGASINPFDFLLGIISKKVSDSEMIDWLVNLITSSLPSIELGVKGILLSNLKKTIDCNNDPRIPIWIRKRIDSSTDDDRGFIFNVKHIDYMNMLSYSPLSEQGQMKYFGTKTYYKFDIDGMDNVKYYSYYDAIMEIETIKREKERNPNLDITPSIENIIKKSEIDNVYELARAKDFNAFLWFVINKVNVVRKTEIDKHDLREYEYSIDVDGTSIIKKPFDVKENSGTTSVLDCFNGEYRTAKSLTLPFTQGSVIVQRDGEEGQLYKTLSMCINMKELNITDNIVVDDNIDYSDSNVFDDVVVLASKPKDYIYSFVPYSDNERSANWYVNSGSYFNFLKPENQRVERKYNEDFAICNLECLGINELRNASINGEPFPYVSDETYIKFTILPPPLVHTPTISMRINDSELIYDGEPIWRFKKILFNSKGEPDNNGHFTVSPSKKYKRYDDEVNRVSIYRLIDSNDTVTVRWDDGSYTLNGSITNLIECYPGLTVYDFNYNYVMGMQLFDPSVIASQLIELATNISMSSTLGLNISVNKYETEYQMRISEIVKKIIESTAYEASDCFFSFSNDNYNELIEKSELKRSKGYAFSDSSNHSTTISIDDAYSILSEYDDNATLNENKDVFTRAITTATAKISDEVLPEDRYNVTLNIIQELIKGIVFVIVNSLLTPKIVLLFEVNKRLMGDSNSSLSIEDFIESISGLITAIVVEIRDMILRELLNWVISILTELVEKLSSMLLMEQLEYYTRLMKALLKACSIKLPSRKLLDSQLDYVDYADIDEIDKPITNEC